MVVNNREKYSGNKTISHQHKIFNLHANIKINQNGK